MYYFNLCIHQNDQIRLILYDLKYLLFLCFKSIENPLGNIPYTISSCTYLHMCGGLNKSAFIVFYICKPLCPVGITVWKGYEV